MASKRGRGGGANCTLSYTRDGVQRAWRLRCYGVVHGVQQVANESRGRETRAMYPFKRTPAQFICTFDLLGRTDLDSPTSEYERFNLWLREYMRFLLDHEEDGGAGKGMNIVIPVRNFSRQGIPLGPLSFGEHVGSMVWRQQITFETTYEPLDTTFRTSSFDPAGTEKDRNARFFYPPGEQLSGHQMPSSYDVVNTKPGAGQIPGPYTAVPSPTAVNAAVTGRR